MFYKELLLLLLLLLLLFVTFIQGIYKYIPEINHVSRVYNVAATLWFQFMVPVMLFPKINVSYFYLFSSFVVWILLFRLFFLFIAVSRVSRECRIHCSIAPLTTIRLCETGFARCTECPVRGFETTTSDASGALRHGCLLPLSSFLCHFAACTITTTCSIIKDIRNSGNFYILIILQFSIQFQSTFIIISKKIVNKMGMYN